MTAGGVPPDEDRGPTDAGPVAPAARARPLEVELKYRLADAADAERFLAAERLGPLAPRGIVRSRRVEDRYVDSVDGALAQAGFAARMRRIGSRETISIKSTGAGERALHRREEIEGPTDGRLSPTDWPASDARSFLLELCGDGPLVEVVALRQRRRQREFAGDGAVVEMSIDDVRVHAGGRRVERFAEMELELKAGDEAILARIDDELTADANVQPATGSKFERALQIAGRNGLPGRSITDAVASTASSLAETRPPRLATGRSPGVTADDSLAEAGRKVLRFHLARMIAREPGTRAGTEPEELHAMRVATRRMRAAWRVFGDAYRPGPTRRYRRRLREVAARLGAVRDLDVLIDGAMAYRAALPPAEAAAFDPLLAAWRSQRRDALVLLLRELDGDGYRRFVDDFRDFVRTPGAGVAATQATQPHRVRDTMGSRAWAAYEHVRAFEPVLRWADVETLHELRIAAKRLRYCLEFGREALGPAADPLIDRTVAVQDHLGLLNDAQVSAGLARAFLVDAATALTAAERDAVGRFLVSREREVQRLRRSFGSTWRGIGGARFRRGLGRAIATL